MQFIKEHLLDKRAKIMWNSMSRLDIGEMTHISVHYVTSKKNFSCASYKIDQRPITAVTKM
jgi:hypothetical protein